MMKSTLSNCPDEIAHFSASGRFSYTGWLSPRPDGEACFHAAARGYANPFDTGFWHIDSHCKDAGRVGSRAAGKSTKV